MTKSKHGEEKKELLEKLSPITAAKIRNTDEGQERLLEYLMVEEKDIQIPVIPQLPKIVISVKPIKFEEEPETEDSEQTESSSSTTQQESTSHEAIIDPSMKNPSYHSVKEPTSIAESSIHDPSLHSIKNPSIHEISHHSIREPSIKEISIKDPSVREMSHHSRRSFSPSQSSESEIIQQVKLPQSEHSIQIKKQISQTDDLHDQESTMAERVKKYFVELTDWSEYIRFKESKTCKQKCFKFCVIFLLLLILSILLFMVWMMLQCCFGIGIMGIAALTGQGSGIQQGDSAQSKKFGKQLQDLQTQLNEYKTSLLNHNISISNITKQLAQPIKNINISKDFVIIQQKLQNLEAQIEQHKSLNLTNLPKDQVIDHMQNLGDFKEDFQNLQKNLDSLTKNQDMNKDKILKLEQYFNSIQVFLTKAEKQFENMNVNTVSLVDQIADNFTLLNADPRDVTRIQKSIGKALQRNKKHVMFMRNYHPGNCYPTVNQAFFEVSLKFPAMPRYFVVGHPYSKTLQNGRTSVPQQINIILKKRTETADEKLVLKPITFDVEGPKEQVFDLYEFGLSENDVILGFRVNYNSQFQTMCAYFMGMYGRYEQLERK
eukprot:EST43979.1 hypothetical protein SS50377_16287 [Spironucleus salmonicida]